LRTGRGERKSHTKADSRGAMGSAKERGVDHELAEFRATSSIKTLEEESTYWTLKRTKKHSKLATMSCPDNVVCTVRGNEVHKGNPYREKLCGASLVKIRKTITMKEGGENSLERG